jgi:hypothetical protein
MTNGIDPVSLAVLVGLSVVFVFVAKVGLNRRDLRG